MFNLSAVAHVVKESRFCSWQQLQAKVPQLELLTDAPIHMLWVMASSDILLLPATVAQLPIITPWMLDLGRSALGPSKI